MTARLGAKLGAGLGWTHLWWCPGCEEVHGFNVDPGKGRPLWALTGTLDKPTVRPSIKVTGGPQGARTVCHVFITDGMIGYLNDCTHALAGQEVPLPDLPDWVVD